MRNSKVLKALGVAATAAAAIPASAWGYGIEIPENGAVAFGRGGAFVARASDPSAVMHNVSGIMGLSGFQLVVSANVGSFSNCFQRSGNYQSGADASINVGGTVFDNGMGDAAYFGRPYPQVCKDPSVALAAMVLGTYRINRWIGVGFGVYSPSTQGSAQHFADTSTLAGGVLAPSPARNLLYQKDLLVLHPVVAVAVQPTRWLRFGLGIEPSIANLQFGLNVNADATGPQSPQSDVFIHLNGTGFFMAGSLSTQVLATPFLSFGAQFHYNFPIDASGTADSTANPYGAAAGSHINSQFEIQHMQVQLPWNVRAGVRYNMPRAGRPQQNDGSGHYDPMSDDVFDIEAVFNYEHTSDLSSTALTNNGHIVIDRIGSFVPAPASIAIHSDLSDVLGVRLGGDWNAIPGVLAIRAGASYETAGVSPTLAQIHLPAYAGASVHAGLSYRWRWLTISAGYGHFFFQNNDATSAVNAVTIPPVTVTPGSPPPAGYTAQGQIDPNTGCGSAHPTLGAQACTVNRGVYSASFDTASIQFAMHF